METVGSVEYNGAELDIDTHTLTLTHVAQAACQPGQ